MKNYDDLKKMIKECLKDDSDRLSPWEIEFLDQNANCQRGFFTIKQTKIIERIWNELFGVCK